MKKRRCFFVFLIIILVNCLAVPAQADEFSWKDLVQRLQSRLERGALGTDVRVSFQNRPYGEYKAEELIAYTLRGDGWVIIQKHNKVKELKVSPNELIWLCKFLLEHGLFNLPEHEAPINNSAAYGLIISIEGKRKSVQLYNLSNDVNREIIWQYLFRLGQRILTEVGFRDETQPLLPVCKGIIKYTEIDRNNDSQAEWLKLDLGFYNFKPGDYVIDFGGYKQKIFLAQGNAVRQFALNTYLLSNSALSLKDYLKFTIDSLPPNSLRPYILNLGLDSDKYKLNNFRLQPDLVFRGYGKYSFRLRLNQTVILGIKRSNYRPYEILHRFSITEITPDQVRIGPGEEDVFSLDDQETILDFYGCVSNTLRLKAIEGNEAVFEIGWSIPDKESLNERIDNYKNYIASGEFKDNEESLKFSVGYSEECLRDIETMDELAINVIYCQPLEEML